MPLQEGGGVAAADVQFTDLCLRPAALQRRRLGRGLGAGWPCLYMPTTPSLAQKPSMQATGTCVHRRRWQGWDQARGRHRHRLEVATREGRGGHKPQGHAGRCWLQGTWLLHQRGQCLPPWRLRRGRVHVRCAEERRSPREPGHPACRLPTTRPHCNCPVGHNIHAGALPLLSNSRNDAAQDGLQERIGVNGWVHGHVCVCV